MHELRWFKLHKTAKPVLQYRIGYQAKTTKGVIGLDYIEMGSWQDIPTVTAPGLSDLIIKKKRKL